MCCLYMFPQPQTPNQWVEVFLIRFEYSSILCSCKIFCSRGGGGLCLMPCCSLSDCGRLGPHHQSPRRILMTVFGSPYIPSIPLLVGGGLI